MLNYMYTFILKKNQNIVVGKKGRKDENSAPSALFCVTLNKQTEQP